MPNEPQSAKQELVALATWRQILIDREQGVTRTRDDYAAMFPGAGSIVLAELAALADDPGALGAKDRSGAVVGHYKLQRLLGRGGQAQVWQAADFELSGREVALKLIAITGRSAAGAALRLRREIEVAARINVPGVCPVYDTGHDGEFAWVAMRLVPGQTLAQQLHDKPGPPGAIELQARLLFLERCARIVHSVHECGVVHRDLKPSNVMVERGEPIVLDFGVARALEEDHEHLTATGLPVGTPAYMAPEQVRGGRGVGAAADVWALGVMLYEAVTGQRPFAGATTFELNRSIVEDTPVDPRRRNRAVPRDLRVVLETALAKDSRHRYRSAEALADDLQRVQQRRPVAARPIGPIVRMVRFAQRRPGLFAALAALALVILAALVVGVVLLKAADRELQRADRELLRADRAQKFVYHLSDQYRLRALIHEIEEELAIDSRRLDQFDRVDIRGSELLARRLEHQDFLASLRSQAVPTEAVGAAELATDIKNRHELAYFEGGLAYQQRILREAEASGVGSRIEEAKQALASAESLLQAGRERVANPQHWRFADDETRAMHDQIADLVEALDRFGQQRPGLSTAVAARVLGRAAAVIRRDSVQAHAEEWNAACGRIAAPTGPYSGLNLAPQEGLVPLGPDPRSHLEEFCHVATGSVPTRDPATGALVYEPDAAIVFVLLPGGMARMGTLGAAPPEWSPQGGYPPAVQVPLAPFFLGKHEVTQAQWFKITWKWAAIRQQTYIQGIEDPVQAVRNPVETVSAVDADQYARRLCLQLPTEAQWEHACRAGSAGAFWFGEEPGQMHRFGNVLEANGDRRMDPPLDGHFGHAEVGTYEPNAWGLHDLHGNVGEWTADLFGSYSLPKLGPAGLRQPGPFSSRVVRGGSFLLSVWHARSFVRRVEPPHQELEDVGVRVARRIEEPPPK